MDYIQDPTRLLNAATATGAGPAYNLYGVYSKFTFNKLVAGTFSALVVNYEGSVNGTDWFTIGTDNATTSAATFVVDKCVRHVRANVGTFTGGTSVTVDMLPAF